MQPPLAASTIFHYAMTPSGGLCIYSVSSTMRPPIFCWPVRERTAAGRTGSFPSCTKPAAFDVYTTFIAVGRPQWEQPTRCQPSPCIHAQCH